MRFTVRGLHRDRPVVVTWDDGDLDGDATLVAELQALDGVAEPVRTMPDGSLRFVDLADPETALDTIFYVVQRIDDIEGDVPAGVTVEELIEGPPASDALARPDQ